MNRGLKARPGSIAAGAAGGLRLGRWPAAAWRALSERFLAALQSEIDARRPFLWLPVAAGAGVLLYMAAEREPVLWLPALLTVAFAAAAAIFRRRGALFALCIGLMALFAGFASATWRTARVAAPVLDHIRIARLTGFVEEVDLRPVGARFLLRVATAGLPAAVTPFRVRLTTRRTPDFQAGAFIDVLARLLPPSEPSLPGGYNFARDAYFQRIGAVGSVLGTPKLAPAPAPDLLLRASAALDRARNRLALRVYAAVGSDPGAIAAAMVTGKRDFLSADAKDVIREAGIFHIITISGVQMTLVAGILFLTVRRLLALSRTLALGYPIKKWAAAIAMVGALAYDIATGSRVGTERALFMTLIMLAAVLVERRALTMRNLALAALTVIALEPEAILGASFQLSFAAVAGLIAVYEGRRTESSERDLFVPGARPRPPAASALLPRILSSKILKARHLLTATLFATSATASFMAYDFHELSPYVLIGNPLTLGLIEVFAVPCALIGTLLSFLGLDTPVWLYLGWGIKLILWFAGLIAQAPGSTLHLHAFAPSAILFLALGVVSAVIWRTPMLRATAVIFFVIGIWGAAHGPRQTILIAPTGDALAIRDKAGQLSILSPRANPFAVEQWLRADGDGRPAGEVGPADARCDPWGCVARLPDGRTLSLILDPAAFEEDCGRAAIIVSRFVAPPFCKPLLLIDGDRLREGGAVTLALGDRAGTDPIDILTAHSPDTDRPWSPLKRKRPAWTPPETLPATQDNPQEAPDKDVDPAPTSDPGNP